MCQPRPVGGCHNAARTKSARWTRSQGQLDRQAAQIPQSLTCRSITWQAVPSKCWSSGGNRSTLGVGEFISFTSLKPAPPRCADNRALTTHSMFARLRVSVCGASTQPAVLAGHQPTLQVAAMAKNAICGRLGPMAMRCLIVDDNRDFLRVAAELLRRDGIAVVGVASTGAQARHSCGELRPDVVLLDVDLGDETGFDVAEQLGNEMGSEQPCLILISAYGLDDFADLLASSPAASFLPKGSLSGMAVRAIVDRECSEVVRTSHRDSR